MDKINFARAIPSKAELQARVDTYLAMAKRIAETKTDKGYDVDAVRELRQMMDADYKEFDTVRAKNVEAEHQYVREFGYWIRGIIAKSGGKLSQQKSFEFLDNIHTETVWGLEGYQK